MIVPPRMVTSLLRRILERLEAHQHRRVADQFARSLQDMADVLEVRLDSTVPELEVSVVLRALDIDKELDLHGRFIDLMSESLGSHAGGLSVFTEDEGVPSWARQGKLLAQEGGRP